MGKRPFGRLRHGWDQNGPWGDWLGGCEVDSIGSGQGPVVGSCKYSDEHLSSDAMELVSYL
jgi:hypothetical protein